MRTLEVELGTRSYPIHLVAELPGPLCAAEVLRTIPGVCTALLVTDENVGPLYAEGVAGALEARGVAAPVVTLPPGERTKSLAQVGVVIDAALEARVSRRDAVIALGGGVIGDLAGFAAAILHRGVAFVQVPTTLLSQVDSSVGGKTGVDHAAGKNLIGAFWQPRAVVASLAVLGTLPEREVRCGLAEGLKHGLIADAALVARIEADAAKLRALDPGATAELIAGSCRIKAGIVAQDEREDGPRALLNFGHTLGHALERELGYATLTHGEAVGLGMVWAARLSEALGTAPRGTVRRVASALGALGLPCYPEAPGLPPLAALLVAARSDKKAHGETVRFVLLGEVGQSLIRTLRWAEIGARLEAWREEAR